MATGTIRIVIEGATGRLGGHQHLRALLDIRREGGLVLRNGTRLVPEPLLLGRNPDKLSALAAAHGLAWSTDRDACLADAASGIYFDVSASAGRSERASAAIAAGKHVYLEKPIAQSLEDALALVRQAQAAGVRHGVVQDKLFLPGLRKLRRVRDSGFLGAVLSAKLDFGWWIFDGELTPPQRSSWNYRKRDGGGLVLDMFPHWRYIVDHLIGAIGSVSCRVSTQVPQRRDEQGNRYDVDVEDAALATLELDGGALVQVSSSWATRDHAPRSEHARTRRRSTESTGDAGPAGSLSATCPRSAASVSASRDSSMWSSSAPSRQPAHGVGRQSIAGVTTCSCTRV